MKPLMGRVAMVTGVSRRIGIGFAIAQRLALFGADLFIHSYAPFDAEQSYGGDPQGVPALLEALCSQGGRVEHREANFMDAEAPQEVIDAAIQAFGHLDILVANHAYSTSAVLEDLTADEIDRHLLVNVRATLLLIKAFAAQHDGRPGGRIVMMTSGQQGSPMPSELAYIASKGGLYPLTLSLSAYLAQRGITVNAINPGATDTGYASPELYKIVLEHEPQGRWGVPVDAAKLVAFLCTDDAQWITGQTINSTGGGP
jgi:3-oxoacyl-[acyl-carrier protein] reductase